MTGIWRETDEGVGFDLGLVLMTMEASECPVLVRKDPDGDWTVIIQGPPGYLHAHTADDHAEALVIAQVHAEQWRKQTAREAEREPTQIGQLIDELLAELSRRRNREENPDAETTDPA